MRKFLYITFLVVGFGVLAQDPIAHYTFSGDATDQSGNGNDGAVNGATLSNDRFGRGNSAYFFDGVNDFVSTNQTFSDNQPISVSMWVYWNGTSGDQTAVSWLDAGLTDQMFFGVNGSGLLIFGNGFQTGTSLESSRWVHLSATYDGSQSRIYIDGTLSDVSDPSLSYQFGNLVIGRQGTNSSEYWNGNIDDVKIYNYALSASEISTLYQSESRMPTIMSSSPAANANNVARDANIVFSFDQNIDQSTIDNGTAGDPTDDNIIIHGSQKGLISGIYTGDGTSTITFNPTIDFQPGEIVFVTVTTGVESTSNVPSTKHSFQFTALSASGPGISTVVQNLISSSIDTPSDLSAIDMDQDGDLDLLIAAVLDDKISWFENDGAAYPSFTERVVTSINDGPWRVVAGDVDGDGDVDIVSASRDGNTVVWYENDGAVDPSFSEQSIAVASRPRGISIGDVDGDGDLDIFSATEINDRINWYENDGATNPSFSLNTVSSNADGAYSVTVGDLDGDGDLDLISASQADSRIAWYENNGDSEPSFTEIELSDKADGTDTYSVLTGDMDGDGDLDLIAASRTLNVLSWFENDGAADPTFSEQTITISSTDLLRIAIADMNGDGDLDIVATFGGGQTTALYDNDGGADPIFTEEVYDLIAGTYTSIAVGDLDADGDLDLVLGDQNNNTVVWYENFPFFITTWQTTSDNEEITIPTNGSYTYDYSVDWGDGTVESGFKGDASHTYTTAGTYAVSITGTFPSIYFNFGSEGQNIGKIISIDQWGDIAWETMYYAFAGCNNLTYNATDAPDLSNVTDMGGMFYGASSFDGGDLTNWDVSNVSYMSFLFAISDFSGDVSNWDMSNVTSMLATFQNTPFNGDISSWDVSLVEDFRQMFTSAFAFNSDLSNWEMGSATLLTSMFNGASSFNQDINGWNVSSVTNMQGMFGGASAFNQPLDNWEVGNVEFMGGMFINASAFNQPLNAWNVTSALYMNDMFSGASSFNQSLESWNVSGVEELQNMFLNASSFDQSLGTWDISSVLNMESMFNNSGMSITNYESTLTGWATLESGEVQIPTGIVLGSQGLKYCEGESARTTLINAPNSWTISGDVLDCPDLLAQFLLDGDAIDDSDYGFNGIVFEAELTTDRFGNANSAYAFDGENDKISVTETNQTPTNLTMSAWFYFPEGGGDATHQIVEIDGAAFLAVSEESFLTGLNLDGTFQTPEIAVTHSEWHLGTFTYDGSFLRSYLDGVLFDERENVGPIEYVNSSSPINIGMSAFAGSYFNGSIDDVSIYGRALSEAEISDLYNDRGYINPRVPLAALYSSLGGDNWVNNTNWNSEESLKSWFGVELNEGRVSELYLQNNNLVGELPSEIATLNSLSILYIFNNSISGSIPAEIGNMTNLQWLVLQNNQLSGSIPAEMGNMTSLQNLYLNGNNLTGELPSELGNLENLKLLTVSRNELSGAVPTSLSNLSNIEDLYLSTNQFTSLPDLTGLPSGYTLAVQNNQIGFEDLITNLPLISNGSTYIYSPQSVDVSVTLTVVETEEVTLTTSVVTPNTNYQWYFNDEIIEGADLQDHIFTYDASLEGEYYVVMTNDNLPNGSIKRASYIVRDEVNTAPTNISFADGSYDGVLKEGVPLGTLAAVLTTEDADPLDIHTYTFVSGDGDGFNSSFIISNDSVFTAVEMDPNAAPDHYFRVRSTDAGGEFTENTFVIQVSPIQVCNNDTFTASSGTFGDGSGIFEYEINFSCNWLIELSPENQVRLSFSEFDTEEGYDFVRVYDGTDETATLLAELSGSTIPETIISSSNSLYITFSSDNVINSSGWTANYSQLTPVADYPFTNGSLEDFSGYGNNISVNTATSTSDRLGGGAYYFDGSTSYMQATSTLSGSSVPFTVSAWVRWDGNSSDFTEIVSWWNINSTSKVYLGTSAGSSELRFGDGYVSTGAFIPANEWVHIAATHDGSISSIYINGTLSANSAAGVTQDFGGGDLYIGKQGTNDSEYFGGSIDDVKIYDIALSANEISNLYTATSTTLIAYLPFNDDLEDESGNDNGGTDLGSGNVFANDRLGVGSSAFDFDVANAGALEMSSFANYNFGDEITVMGWIRPDTYPSNDIQLFNNSFLSGTGFEFRLVNEDLDEMKRKLFAGVTGISYGSAGEVYLDEWTHVAFRFRRGQGTSLFINGENLVTYGFVEGTDDFPIPTSSDGIFIGEGFDGLMDEIKVFSTALTDQDIIDEYEENLWPFASLAFRGPEGGGGSTEDRQLALSPEDPSSYLGAVYLYFAGDYQFRATASSGFEAFMGDNELDGIAEPGSTQLALEGGFHAVGFRQSNFEYFVEPITSVGIIGSALTGDNSGWNSDLDLMNLNESVYQIRNIRLYDGEFKLRINDAWDYIDWGSNDLDGKLDYRGSNIPISAGIYTLSFDLHNNKYTIIDLSSNEAVAELDFNGNTLDDSGYENNGSTISTTYTTGRFGSENTAIVLDGTSGVNLGNDPSLNLTNGFTMNIWINPADNESGSELFASGGSFHNHLYATEVAWRYFQNEVEIGTDVYIEAPVDTWTMITWTYDGGAMRFYDDGVLVYTKEVYGDIDINANSYAIGSSFIGAVDAFQWIDGVLSDKEIQYLYNDNLIVDYALDGNTDDQSGNNINGTLPNGGTYIDDRFGNFTVALSLNGEDQYIEVDNANEALITGNEITFEGWFQTYDLTDDGFLLSSPGIIAYIDDSGTLGFAPQTTEASYITESTETINLDEWFHFAGTYDGSTTKIYLNGVETASEQINQEMNISAGGSTRIGGNGSSNFAGFLDDVSVYNYALNASEIAELYGENNFATPIVSGVFPTSGAPGASIRVYGANLSQAGTVVSFGGTVVTPTSIADNVLYFDVPDITSGYNDLIVSNSFDASLSQDFTVLNTNTSDVSFSTSSLISNSINTPVEMHSTDLNGDGYPDLLVASQSEGNLTIHLNNADGTFGLPTTIFTSSNSGSLGLSNIRSGDLDQDGDNDIVFSYLNNMYWFENDGTGTIITSPLIFQLSASFAYRETQLGDLNGDGYLDIVLVNNDGGTIEWLSNDGNASFTYEGIISSSPAAFKLSLNDFDNDGDLDIAQANNTNFILLNEGFGIFSRTDLISNAVNGYNAVTSADFNNDFLIDMAAGAQTDNHIDGYLNGDSEPSNIHQSGDGTSPYDFSIGDVDGDGDIDLVTAFYDGNLTIYINDGNAGFTSQVIDSDVATLSRVTASDIDNDGDLDVFASRESGEIVWYENQIPSDRKEILSYNLSTGATPSDTEYTYIGAFEGSRYYVSSASDTWTNAKATAEALGGHLVIIHSQEENDFINEAVDAVWVGGTDEDVEGQFRWVDGTPFDYLNWGGDEPNGGSNENYVQLNNDGTWNDYDLSNELLPFVVEIPFSQGVIDAANSAISVEMPYGTDISNLVANFDLSSGAFAELNAEVQVSGVNQNDFSNEVTYTVTAEDFTFKNWTVTVSVDDGLFAFYPFNDNAVDESGNGNDATVNGPLSTEDRFVTANSAYYFDGDNDEMLRSETDVIGGEYETSVLIWVNPDDIDNFQYVLNFGNLRSYITSGNINFGFSVDFTFIDYAAEIEVGKWQQFVMTYDANSIKIYKDGILTTEAERYGVIDQGSFDMNFGRNFDGNFYRGALDDIRVYNRALSEDEILSLFSENGWPPLNTETDILTFNVDGERENVINASDYTVDIIVDYNTDISSLTPSFSLSEGAIAVVNAQLQESAVSTNDFTSPVTYTITAEDNTTVQDWLVTISLDSVQGDSLALVALYNATDGDNWTTSWDVLNLPMTEWSGVALDADRRVTGLELNANNLVGSIPSSIGNLSRLTNLNLSVNNISGSLPASIGSLSKLTSIVFESNTLTGSIPVAIGNLNKLNNLNLSGNGLSGSIPPGLGSITELYYLNLSRNNLTGSIPTQLGDLSNLLTLELNSNNLTGTIPVSLGNIGSSLEILFLGSNSLQGSIPEEIGSLSNLYQITLDNNQLSGSIPEVFGSLTDLSSLSLSNNNLAGSIPSSLAIANLEFLDLSNNSLNGDIPTEFAALTGLKFFRVQDNLLESLPDLSSSPLDEGLSVQNNKIGFEDIQVNLGITLFEFNPQTVDQTVQQLVSPASPVTMSTSITTAGTSYQWVKDGGDITGATEATLEVTEPGTYTLVMTNDIAPGLTITRAPYILTGESETEMISFGFEGVQSNVDITDGIVNIEVPFASPSLSSLVAIFELSPGASASISGTPQTSGVDANDFSGTVTYTVTALDGTTTQDWVVNTSIGPNTANDIENFDIALMVGDEVINTDNHSVSILMPYATDRSALIPFIATSANASIEPNSDVVQDFSNPFTYTVTSESGVAQDWIITVTNQKNNETNILTFVIPNQTVTEIIDTDNHTVAIAMPFGTDASSLVPTITLSAGATVNPKSGVAQNFTNPVVYTVIPEDNSASQQWTVTVTVDPNPNSVPTVLSLDDNLIEENSNQVIGTFSNNDPDVDNFVYNLINGIGATNNNSFTISGDELYPVSTFDFETKSSYSILVRVDDQRGGRFDQQFTISVVDVNEVPTISDQTFTVVENQSNGVLIGTVIANDVDNNSLAFSISSGNTGNAFTIDNTGNITVADQNQLDYETNPSFNLTVDVFDGELTASAFITINLTDVVENVPPIISNQIYDVDENTSNGSSIATVVASDDDGDNLTFSITAGNENGALAINSTNGELTVADFALLDFETGTSSYGLTVEVNDGTVSSSAIITVNVNNVNEPTSFSLAGSNPTSNAKEDFTVSATITDDDAIVSVKLFTKKVTGTTFTASANIVVGSDDDYTQTISGTTAMDNIGVEYYFEIEDAFGTQQSETKIVSTVIPDGSKSVNGKFEAGTTVKDYSILAFPFESIPISNVFSQAGVYTEDWRLLTYQNGSLSDKSSGSTSPGVGYWFITKNETASITIGGESANVNNEGVISITLRPDANGYSLIGNPYQGTINWAQVKTYNENNGNIDAGATVSDLIKYNRQFVSGQTSLGDLEGAFVQTTNVTTLDIPSSAVISGGGRVESATNNLQEVYIDDSNWSLDLFFETPSYAYSVSGIGIQPSASDQLDGYDLRVLPRLELYLDLLFEDGSTRSIKKSDDFKSWSFNVRNNLPEELIDLTWDVPVSSNKTIILVDGASQKIVDLKETKSIQMKNNSSVTHQLYFGDKQTIFENLDLTFDAYYGSYPNPVENEMTIEMYGSKQRNVPISLVGLDGKTYSIGNMQLYEGLNKESINLEGFSIPAGVYFLKVDNKVATKILKR